MIHLNEQIYNLGKTPTFNILIPYVFNECISFLGLREQLHVRLPNTKDCYGLKFAHDT